MLVILMAVWKENDMKFIERKREKKIRKSRE